MSKKILSIFIVVAMIFSVLILTGCDKDPVVESEESETPIVLTPKEKFLKTADAAATYFSELKNVLGIPVSVATVGENQAEVNTFGIELQKVSVDDVPMLEEPFGISAEITSDLKNNIEKALLDISYGENSIPVEMIISATATYFDIDKVTDKTLKFPIEIIDFNDFPGIPNEYFDFFMDNLDDSLFTETTGAATIDDTEIANANTVTFKATNKQLLEAVKAVAVKAKTDLRIKSFLESFNVYATIETSETINEYEEMIDELITELDTGIANATDDQYLTFTAINEGDILRSLSLTVFGNNKEMFSLNASTTEKDGIYYVKGALKVKDETVLTFDYNQKANGEGSADGNFVLSIFNVDLTEDDEESEEDDEESEYETSYDYPEVNLFNELVIEADFKGKKTDNSLELDIDVEINVDLDNQVMQPIPINILAKYEVKSETETTYSAEISTSIAGADVEFVLSSSRKIVDYVAIETPSDDNVVVIDDNFDPTSLLSNLMSEYPEFIEFFSGLFGGFGEPTGKMLTNEEIGQTINLNDDGTGTVDTIYSNMQLDDGKIIVEIDGKDVVFEYTIDGDEATINGISGFTYTEYDDGDFSFSNEDKDLYLSTLGDMYYESMGFSYIIEDDIITFNYTLGTTEEFEYADNGTTINIGGLTYTVGDM
ncbi:MAG: hypothetical protein A2Y15_01250 [Clostridiales bacterium GWF2_36_10]|nr:MAG: hypothetical protein A2Y15_01250 [Clostridiales bacterium GWF2_36_10]HAN22028.1 hypothetical protein [Clostridiales bacterium]